MLKALIACFVLSFLFVFLGQLFCNIAVESDSKIISALMGAASVFCLLIGILLGCTVLVLISCIMSEGE